MKLLSLKKLTSHLFLVAAFYYCTPVLGQELSYFDNYKWESKAQWAEPSEKFRDRSAVFISYRLIHEFVYSTKTNKLEVYTIRHYKVALNDEKAIEEFNKISLSSNEDKEFVTIKTRVIQKNGQATSLDEDDIKTATDEDNRTKETYFALKGLEKGSNVEFLQITHGDLNFLGHRSILQQPYPIEDLHFTLISPVNLVFTSKSLNGLADLEINEDYSNNVLELNLQNLDGLKREEQSAYNANLKAVLFKLDKNTSNGKKNIINYASISESMHNIFRTPLKGSDLAKVKKLIKTMKVADITEDKARVQLVEDYLKNRFYIIKSNSDVYSNFDQMLKNNLASSEGMMKLFCAIFDQLNIPFEIVLTCDHYHLRFEKDYEAYNFLTDYLLYFPKDDYFLEPGEKFNRSPWISTDLRNNYGLFIKNTKIGDVNVGNGKVKLIPESDFKSTGQNIVARTKLNSANDGLAVDMKITTYGYYSYFNQILYGVISEEDQKEQREEDIKRFAADAKISSSVWQNTETLHCGETPLLQEAKFETKSMVENAGTKLLVKIGELIGPQAEMYDVNKRQLDLDAGYGRIYNRDIEFTIPEGYEAIGVDSLNISETYSADGKITMQFVSTAKLDGNTIKIKVEEFYTTAVVPVAIFEEYRRVMNAAADFNKKVIVLKKK